MEGLGSLRPSPLFLLLSDPVEAYLADGACVVAWCRAALDAVRAALEDAAAAAPAAAAPGHAAAAAKLAGLVPIAAALGAGGDAVDASGDGSPSASALHADALRLATLASVLDWAAADPATDGNRYTSDAEWRAAVARWRAAAGRQASGRPLFCDAAATAARVGGGAAFYPPPGPPRAAAPCIFLAPVEGGDGGSDAAATSAATRLDLFAYLLADAGAPPSTLASLGARFGAPAARVARWRLQALLDEARAGGPAGDAALDEAAGAAPTAAAPDAAWELGAAFVELGRPDAALVLLRARGAAADGAPPPLAEARAALAARLECGLFSEAYIEARRHCDALDGAAKEDAVADLTTRLAEWGARAGGLPALSVFPLTPAEEKALLAWLVSPAGAAADGPLHAVLYHLMRGRAADALLTAAATGAPSPDTGAGRAALDLLRRAAADLPPALRAAAVVAGGAPPVRLARAGAPLPPRSVPLVEGGGEGGERLLLVKGANGRVPLLAPLSEPLDEGRSKVGVVGAAGAATAPTAAAPLPLPAFARGSGESAGFLTPAPGAARATRSKRARLQATPRWG